jgi:hypothetical protein
MVHIQRVVTRSVTKGNVVTLITHQKKSRQNLPNLYKTLCKELRKLNRFNECHLSSYPYIAVHVINKDEEYLDENFQLIKDVVEKTLWNLSLSELKL